MGRSIAQLRGACDALHERCAEGAKGLRAALRLLAGSPSGQQIAEVRGVLGALIAGLDDLATGSSEVERLRARVRELETERAQLRASVTELADKLRDLGQAGTACALRSEDMTPDERVQMSVVAPCLVHAAGLVRALLSPSPHSADPGVITAECRIPPPHP